MRSSKYYICKSEQSNQKYFLCDFRQWKATLFVRSTKIHKNKSEKSRNKDSWNKLCIEWQISVIAKIEWSNIFIDWSASYSNNLIYYQDKDGFHM